LKKFALLTLAAGVLLTAAGAASAQYYSGPGYGPHIEPYYQQGYDRRYDDGRYYRRVRNGCPRGFTVQDGRCKPYRGY